MDERESLAGGNIAKVDSASVLIFTLDAHELILSDSRQSRRSMPSPRAIRSIFATGHLTMPTMAVAVQSLETIAGWNAQIV